MLDMFKKHPRYVIGAVLVHLFFLILFGVGFHFTTEHRAASTQPKTVNVTTVDEKLVQKELRQMKAQDDLVQQQKQAAIRKRKQEEKRLADLRTKRLAEQKKEKQRLALAAQKEKELKQKQLAEEKRLKDLAEKRRKEEERQERERSEKALQQQMAAEAKRMQAEQEAAVQRRAAEKARQDMISKYMNAIENKIYQNWRMPPSVNKGLACVLEVKLIPGGEVISIVLSQSSGDKEFDNSVIAAVRAASPLPVPSAASGDFEPFRNLTLPVRADKKT